MSPVRIPESAEPNARGPHEERHLDDAADATRGSASRREHRSPKPERTKAQDARGYALGLALALLLTAVAFAAVAWPIAPPGPTLAAVLLLAMLQMGVHLRWFLHVTLARDARDKLQLVLFSGLVVLLMVAGTLVILLNQSQRMS